MTLQISQLSKKKLYNKWLEGVGQILTNYLLGGTDKKAFSLSAIHYFFRNINSMLKFNAAHVMKEFFDAFKQEKHWSTR